jgi:hypothetical protein
MNLIRFTTGFNFPQRNKGVVSNGRFFCLETIQDIGLAEEASVSISATDALKGFDVFFGDAKNPSPEKWVRVTSIEEIEDPSIERVKINGIEFSSFLKDDYDACTWFRVTKPFMPEFFLVGFLDCPRCKSQKLEVFLMDEQECQNCGHIFHP